MCSGFSRRWALRRSTNVAKWLLATVQALQRMRHHGTLRHQIGVSVVHHAGDETAGGRIGEKGVRLVSDDGAAGGILVE